MTQHIAFGVFMLINTSFFAQDLETKDSLNLEQRFERISIIPNPTSEILFIRHGEEITSYQLYNMQGAKVQESKNNPQVISLIDEEVGFYFLILEIQGEFKSFRVQKY